MHSNWRDCKEWEQEGLKLSTTSNEASKLYDATLTQYVGWYEDATLGGLGATCDKMLAADPNFVMGRALAYGLDLYETGKSYRTDSSFRKDIENLVSQSESPAITLREKLHVKAIKQWADGLLPEATTTWEDILLDYPHDILAAKIAQMAYFFLGQSIKIRDSIARVLPRWKPSMPLYGYMHGMYAFGLEEANLYPEAQLHATKGLELNKNDAWSTHALAHVYEMTGQQNKGIEMMQNTEADWARCGILAGHNYWHLALYYLDKGDYEAALNIYDKHHAKRILSGTVFDVVDCSSMLFRLQLEGVNVNKRWNAIHEICKQHTEDHSFVFDDFHIMLTFANVHDQKSADCFLSTMQDFMKEFPKHYQAAIAKNVGYDVCKAFLDYSAGQYEQVVDTLYPLRYKIIDAGGSHAQRDIFNLLLINAALKSSKSQHRKLARVLLTERKILKENSSLTDRLIGRAMACHAE